MPRPLVLPFPLPRLGALQLRRRWRRARRSRLAWWLCAVAIGTTAALQIDATAAELREAPTTCEPSSS